MGVVGDVHVVYIIIAVLWPLFIDVPIKTDTINIIIVSLIIHLHAVHGLTALLSSMEIGRKLSEESDNDGNMAVQYETDKEVC